MEALLHVTEPCSLLQEGRPMPHAPATLQRRHHAEAVFQVGLRLLQALSQANRLAAAALWPSSHAVNNEPLKPVLALALPHLPGTWKPHQIGTMRKPLAGSLVRLRRLGLKLVRRRSCSCAVCPKKATT